MELRLNRINPKEPEGSLSWAEMRPSGTTGTALLLLLAALCAAGGALEEKKGKGVSAGPRPQRGAFA